MSKKQHLIFIVIYWVINALVYLMIAFDYLTIHCSMNVLFGLMVSGILGGVNYFIGFLIHMILSSLMFYVLGRTVKRKFELIIYILMAAGASIPFLNGSGM